MIENLGYTNTRVVQGGGAELEKFLYHWNGREYVRPIINIQIPSKKKSTGPNSR
jgi:hypothetical protein